MSTTVQHKRGTAGQIAAYTGVVGELVVNTTDSRLVLADGTTPGGVPIAKKTEVDFLKTRGTAIASASPLVLSGTTGEFVHVTGTTGFSAVTLSEGHERTVVFDGVLTMTPSATLVVPGGLAITTAAGDRMIVRGDAGGVVNVISYTKASGLSVINPVVPKFGARGTGVTLFAAGAPYVGVGAITSTQGVAIYTSGNTLLAQLFDSTGALQGSALTLTSTMSALAPTIVQIDSGRVLVVYSQTTGTNCFGVIITASGSTISAGTPGALFGSGGAASAASEVSVTIMSPTKAWVMTYRGGNTEVAAITLGTTSVTNAGAGAVISSSYGANGQALCSIDSTHAIAIIGESSGGRLVAYALAESAGLPFLVQTKELYRAISGSYPPNVAGISSAVNGRMLAVVSPKADSNYGSGLIAISELLNIDYNITTSVISVVGRPVLVPSTAGTTVNAALTPTLAKISATTAVIATPTGSQPLPNPVSVAAVTVDDEQPTVHGGRYVCDYGLTGYPRTSFGMAQVGSNLATICSDNSNSLYPTLRMLPMGTVT